MREWSAGFESYDRIGRGKLPGAAARLSGLPFIALSIHNSHGEPILMWETMQQALDLAAVASSHAEVAFNLMGADADH